MSEPGTPYSPSLAELLRAVREFLEQAAGELNGHSRFLAKSSVYVLGICDRELRDGVGYSREEQERFMQLLGTAGTLSELRRQLSRKIRSGEFDSRWDALIDELLAATINEVRVVKANHLSVEHRSSSSPEKT